MGFNALYYNINGIPVTVFLDPFGKVIDCYYNDKNGMYIAKPITQDEYKRIKHNKEFNNKVDELLK